MTTDMESVAFRDNAGAREVGDSGAVRIENPVFARLFYLVDTDDGVMRNIGIFDIGELGLELFFGRIDQQLGLFAENDFANLDKTRHMRLADFVSIQFIDSATVVELDTKSGFRRFCHILIAAHQILQFTVHMKFCKFRKPADQFAVNNDLGHRVCTVGYGIEFALCGIVVEVYLPELDLPLLQHGLGLTADRAIVAAVYSDSGHNNMDSTR